MKTLPFTEEKISDGIYKRTFDPSTESEELKWHQDPEDRIVIFLGNTDWMYQEDDVLPVPAIGEFFIPAGKWHRLLKGKTKLDVIIQKF